MPAQCQQWLGSREGIGGGVAAVIAVVEKGWVEASFTGQPLHYGRVEAWL